MNVYMEITKDEYELPLAIGNTIEELARIVKMKPNNIACEIYRAKTKKSKARFIRVDIGDEE